MRHVAFVRNLNQGQRGHVTTADLVASFVDAGCHDPVPFQSNGTVVFGGDAERAQDAAPILAARAGVKREVFTLTLDELGDIVSDHGPAPDADRRELTLHDGGSIVIDAATQAEAARRRCTLLESAEGWSVTLNERDRESNATPVIERLTGAPATSRGLPTLIRLVARFPRA
ncbi:DUF1697 domain-containing protein [Microbacterium enclense]|uniref:DUF1697 domain-containing protein n=1 Tax=Microbacterium enclense TaxID=993073 RepID=A0A3S3L1A2_9MICO|nr:DUF1697 domain-containing protein [Microbacterium enclense]RWR21792.1 DUF1697 domain-containing protein [Microbacterium enclense]